MAISGQHHFDCIQCGSQLDFTPGTLQMHCTHCGFEHDIEVSHKPILEYNYHQTLAFMPEANDKTAQMMVQCEACGANTNFGPNIHADECPFCGTKVVLDSIEARFIQPKSLLPFSISSTDAKAFYKKWLKRLWFAPSKLKKYSRQEKDLQGVYVPYWTYDCATTTDYKGERGDIYYVRQQVRVKVNGRWTTRMQNVPKIRWSPAYGQIRNHFDDTLIYASDTLMPEVANKLEPWDLDQLQPYQTEFISGFRSELYHTGLEDGFTLAKQRIHTTIQQSVRHDIGGDQQRIHQLQTQYANIQFKHLLLPYWIAGFRFRRKTYQFIVNGRTGEVQGGRPWSIAKISFAIVGIILLVFIFIIFAEQ